MANKTSGEKKPISLRVKIMHLERRILDRQRHLLDAEKAIGQNFRGRLTSPSTFLWAAGIGLLIGHLTGSGKVGHESRVRNRRRASPEQSSFVTRLLKVVAMTRAFLAAWPPGWVNALRGLGQAPARDTHPAPLTGAPGYANPTNAKPTSAKPTSAHQHTVSPIGPRSSDPIH